MMVAGIPNGFIVVGPEGRPVLFDFNIKGKVVCGSGKTMPMQGWLLEYGERIPEDVVVLVEHMMSDDGRLLMKCLDSGLLWDGVVKLSVLDKGRRGELWGIVEKFREEHMGRLFG